jgi:hypothetical protein
MTRDFEKEEWKGEYCSNSFARGEKTHQCYQPGLLVAETQRRKDGSFRGQIW